MTAQIFCRWREVPSEHWHSAKSGDMVDLSDQQLESISFNGPVNLPPMPKVERRQLLRPVLQEIVNHGTRAEQREPGAADQ